jgi:hypothetical protein
LQGLLENAAVFKPFLLVPLKYKRRKSKDLSISSLLVLSSNNDWILLLIFFSREEVDKTGNRHYYFSMLFDCLF